MKFYFYCQESIIMIEEQIALVIRIDNIMIDNFSNSFPH
jgi:hypothetical protein